MMATHIWTAWTSLPIGYWGEGWSPYMPAFAYQQPLIDLWLNAFTKTPLLMNFDEPEALTYGTAHGAGWRLDCLGDMRTSSDDPYFPAEMLEIYPQQVVRSGVQNVWQQRPVSLETCGTPSSWKRDGFDVDYILNQALRWHVSSVNVKSSPIPPEWKSNFERFEKMMGYRFVLRRLEYLTRRKGWGHDADPHVVAECRSGSDLSRVCPFGGIALCRELCCYSDTG